MGGVHVPHLVLHVSDLHDNCHHHCRSRDGLVFRSSLICIWRTWHTHVEFQRNAVGTRLCMFAFWNSRGDDSAVPAVFGVDDLCPERPENRNFAQTNRQDLRYRQTIQLQHIATSTDTALSTDHARRHLLADLSCDILLEPVAKLGLWLHDAELSCLRASPGRLDMTFSKQGMSRLKYRSKAMSSLHKPSNQARLKYQDKSMLLPWLCMTKLCVCVSEAFSIFCYCTRALEAVLPRFFGPLVHSSWNSKSAMLRNIWRGSGRLAGSACMCLLRSLWLEQVRPMDRGMH